MKEIYFILLNSAVIYIYNCAVIYIIILIALDGIV